MFAAAAREKTAARFMCQLRQYELLAERRTKSCQHNYESKMHVQRRLMHIAVKQA